MPKSRLNTPLAGSVLVRSLCILLLAVPVVADSLPAMAQTAPVLSGVHRIYVERLGHGKVGDDVRDRVISRLRKNSNLEVVGTAEKADAVLSGTAEVWVTGYVSDSPRSPSRSPCWRSAWRRSRKPRSS